MKKLIILFSSVLMILVLSSCEKQELNNEIYESELQMVDPTDDGTVDPGDDDRY
ncbi:hypothetical protein [Aquimarina mytili]|uniref:Uncharacterized protein n=1 Tax=Aquimarina mytili TaxID=874423 RepID=A0A936ZXX4_9FLAO|nr:hypothetical protein [Aquimarina mytili]MBL0684321.1 hypothetical protein [Aquimarina mytili]